MSVDEKLIKRCAKNDREAQKILFETYSPKMWVVCLRYCKNPEDAKDLLHDGFIKVFLKISSFRGESSFDTWISKIFVYTCLSQYRKGRMKYTHSDIEFEDKVGNIISDTEGQKPEETDPWADLSPEEAFRMVDDLPDKYKIVVNLYSVDGFSHKEIADQLGMSESASKSRLSRARMMLAERLKERKDKE